MKQLNYGKEYHYAHDGENHFVNQQYLPEAIKYQSIWHSAENPAEQKQVEWLRKLWKDRF
jgi:putative ATPase